MAEAFGIAAGAAGFVSLLVQIISGIDTLHDIIDSANKAPAELASLINELEFLKRLLEEFVGRESCNDDLMLPICHASCASVVKDFEKLKKCVPSKLKGTARRQKLLRMLYFRHWKEDLEALKRSIESAKISLILANNMRLTSALIKESMLVHPNYISSQLDSASERNSYAPPPLLLASAPSSSDESKVESQVLSSLPSPKFKHHWNCAERQCSCCCHYTARTKQRFWALEYTPLHVFQQACDNKSCNTTKYGGSFRIALSQLGIRWSAVIQFHILAAPGKFLFRPSLDVERIVPYTSPGFETLWRCKNNLITLKEAQDKLVDLHRSDRTFKDHVNPGGESYIEELLRAPWGGPVSNAKQYALLELFMREFEMIRGTKTVRFLARCAEWIGEGPHLELLEILLELGFDASLVDSPHARDWPEPSSPNWYAEDLAPDPFFVKYQSMLLKGNQGFAKMTPLHEDVLLGSLKNFLGQTPLHLAISNLGHLLALVESGHDVDAADNYSITPLMYAAAVNSEECLIALLEAGANPNLRDMRYQRTFMQYAAIRGHWNLIFRFLCWIENVARKEVAESWAQHAIILYYVLYPDYIGEREISLQQLLAKCGFLPFTFHDLHRDQENNNLLYYVKSVQDIEVLLEYGFTSLNDVNSMGQHALIGAILYGCEPAVVHRLLSAGADVDAMDNLHHTALYYALNKLQNAYGYDIWIALDTIRILLANGADVLCKDHCRCPCSPSGCLTSGVLEHSIYEEFAGGEMPIWSLEWLSLIQEQKGVIEAKKILLLFIRKVKFDMMGMTHVCCHHRNRGTFSRILFPKPAMLDDDNIDEILDEESEFVKILENEMALSSTKAYETLLNEWILQFKVSLEKFREEAMEYNKNTTAYTAPYESNYLVDYRNDSFAINLGCDLMPKDPVRLVTPGIARYICWMEHEYRHGSTPRLDMDKFPNNEWYFRRVAWLYRLINALEISTIKIADGMRAMVTPGFEGSSWIVNVEESIEHFLSWWEIGKERPFSLVNDVEK